MSLKENTEKVDNFAYYVSVSVSLFIRPAQLYGSELLSTLDSCIPQEIGGIVKECETSLLLSF